MKLVYGVLGVAAVAGMAFATERMLADPAGNTSLRVVPGGALTPAAMTQQTLTGGVVADPGNPAVAISTNITMDAGGTAVPVRAETLNYTPSTRAYDVAKMTVAGPTTITLTSPTAIGTNSIDPPALGITGTVSGNTMTFDIPGPINLVIHIAGHPDLLLIATPTETETYTASAPGVVYYGPGIHDVGVVAATSNTIYYLAPGALVKGVFNLFNVQNVRIIGRGLIDGQTYSGSVFTQPIIYANNASNVQVQGVGVRHANGVQSHYVNSDHIDVSYLNMLGGIVVNRDGIDLDGVEDATIRNCLIYSGDDGFGWHAIGSGTAPYGTVPNFPMARVLADNNVTYNDVGGNVMRLGSSFETDYVRDITVRNQYGLHWDQNAFRNDMSDYANLRNIVLENWYLSSNQSAPIYAAVGKTQYSNPNGYLPGSIDGLSFRNFNAPGTSFTLAGYDATHQISNIDVEQVTLGGNLVLSTSQISNRAFTSGYTFAATVQPHLESTSGVVDNGGTGYATTGSWLSSTLPGFNGGTTTYTLTSGATATFTPSLASAGYYTVYVMYPYAENSTHAASYSVHAADGNHAFTVDQVGLAGIWRSLGTWKFAAGTSGQVVLTANGRTRADAVKFEPAYIVDNSDTGFATTGSWASSTLTGFNGTSTIYSTAAGATATWTPNLPTAGRYAVYAWFPTYTNSDTAAQYSVAATDGTKTVQFSQRTYAGKWRSLGIFNLPAGSGGTVKLTSSGANARADAVYFVRIP